jgi:choline monooxygenase
MEIFHIDEDIRKSDTLPSFFYRERVWFDRSIAEIWEKCWIFIGDNTHQAPAGTLTPLVLLPDVLNEPVVLSTDVDGEVYCLSNVCTHRGKLVVSSSCSGQRILRCGYHGRCFRLNGTFKSMPEFDQTENFPTEKDHLKQLPLATFFPLYFTSIDPLASFATFIQPMLDRVSFLPLHTLTFNPDASRDFDVRAHWALYVDNYLEGFHIPFVHPALNQAIEFEKYEYHLFEWGNLQIGVAADDEPYFDTPKGHVDEGKRIYAYYFWIFPNLMFNFYPWGLSLNIVEPKGHQMTVVKFRSYYFEGTTFDREKNQLDATEFEDEEVVESVQKGMQGRYYSRGRYSVNMEINVHHFHRIISNLLNKQKD